MAKPQKPKTDSDKIDFESLFANAIPLKQHEKVMPPGSELEEGWSLVRVESDYEIHKNFAAEFDEYEAAKAELQRLLEPLIGIRKTPRRRRPKALTLRMQLVPEPLWGQNMRKALPTSQWRRLRQEILQERGPTCEVCGAHVSETRNLIAHEHWQYEVSQDSGVARLTAIVLQCLLCDRATHYGHTRFLMQNGKIKPRDVYDVITHFLAVNDVTLEDFGTHEIETRQEHAALCRITDWRIDFGPYQALVDAAAAKRAQR